MSDSSDRIFIFGLGYSAQVLARDLLARGLRVAGTTRNSAKAAALRAQGIEPFLFDRGRPLDPGALTGTTHLLSSVPPDGAPGGTGDPVLDHHGADIAALAGGGQGSGGLRWVGYLSTTGVYGDTAGAWVDEDSAVNPASPRGRARAAAEAAWLDLNRRQGVPVHLFRLPGIYGPGRSSIDSLRAGTARRIDKPGQVFSRIHAADIAQVLAASMARPRGGAIYNVCDDEPAPAHEVVRFAAALMGIDPPPLEPFDPATLSPMAASFYAETKRVRNDRMKAELGIRLRYPTYRDGLGAQWREETGR
ncbi:MAG: hypothetical protein RLY86_2658 [Pseudomonadota bacterium]|jgi:nucleoside-diphosphate-sugar epimerase